MRAHRMALGLSLAFLAAWHGNADATSDKEALARKFSPILILTKDNMAPDRRVLHPEEVEIVGAQSAANLRFEITGKEGSGLNSNSITFKKVTWESFPTWEPPLIIPGVDFSANQFAFLPRSYTHTARANLPGAPTDTREYTIKPFFDYPGDDQDSWNNAYDGSSHRGDSFSNTAYVHIYKTTHATYPDSITVIQYFYFYPYNDWWNNHEGDWPRVHVVVNSSDPSDANLKVLGVEYLFHGAHLSYYRDYGSKPNITSNFVFDPQSEIRLNQGTHPVIYVGVGSHGLYPTGGTYTLYEKDNVDRAIVASLVSYLTSVPALLSFLLVDQASDKVTFYERMSHTGLVLSTEVAGNSALQERYDLEMLPAKLFSEQTNKGLTGSMSWFGADVRWGDLEVDSPLDRGNESPRGPRHKGWENLKFFTGSSFGPNWVGGFTSESFGHGDLPYNSYHHWAIVGDESWSGTLTLRGDIVVLPGATLTIAPSTVIEFKPEKDIHQFAPDGIITRSDLAEIFVYGTLTANGESGKPIVFQREGRTSDSAPTLAWGGIRPMDGASINMNSHARVHDAPALTVTYGADSYEVPFNPGSLPSTPTLGEQGDRSVSVTVEMTPPAYRALAIPVTVSAGDAESGDYTVSGLTSGGLVFAVGDRFQSFTVTAHPDDDTDYEHLTLSFGTLPEEVVAGEPATATLTIHDVGKVPPKPEEGLLVEGGPSITPGNGILTVRWDAVSATPPVTGYELHYQERMFWQIFWPATEWLPLSSNLGKDDTRYPHGGLNWLARYRYRVRATNDRGEGPWSDAFPENGVSPRAPFFGVAYQGSQQVTFAAPCPAGVTCGPPGDALGSSFTTEVQVQHGTEDASDWQPQSHVFQDGAPSLSGADGLIVTAEYEERLDPAVIHRFQVRIVDADGQEGEASDPTWLVPLDAQAGANAGEVDLSWRTPADASLTGLVYQYRSGTDALGPWQEIVGSGSSTTQYTVDGLTPGVNYQFQVRAVEGPGTQTGDPAGARGADATGRQGAGAVRTRVTSFTGSATPARPDTRGRVEWSTTQPRVGQELTPTLIDPDNPALAEARWRWRRQRWSRSDAGDSLSAPAPESRSGESKLAVIARTRQYRPRVSDLNQWLWVEVTYTDDYTGDSRRHRVSATASRAVGPGPPCAPANLKAAPGDGQVTLTWEAGCNNGGTIDRYQYRRPDAVKWVRVPGDGSAGRQQVTGLTNGEAHTFEVRARNGQGWGPSAQATATPEAERTVSFAAAAYQASEGGEAATVTVRLSRAASYVLRIPIAVNPRSGDFTVAGLTDGELSFAPEADEATFTITASEDADTVDETVTLGFGTPLPAAKPPEGLG